MTTPYDDQAEAITKPAKFAHPALPHGIEVPVEVPQFEHDCNRCDFLGRYQGHDLYYCEQAGYLRTVIARFGDDGPDYISGMSSAEQLLVPELVEAKKRWEHRRQLLSRIAIEYDLSPLADLPTEALELIEQDISARYGARQEAYQKRATSPRKSLGRSIKAWWKGGGR